MKTRYTRITHAALALLVLSMAACGGGGGGGSPASGSDAALSGLSISTGVLVSAFDPATLAYTVDVNNATASITVTPTTSSVYATIKVNNAAVASGAASAAIALNVGANPISIVVTAQDGTTTKSYTITVTRQAAPPSTDATLAGLTISAGTLAPVFASATTAYTDLVPMAGTSVDVTATTISSNATMTVNGAAVASGTLKNVAVPVGQSTITIVVTAQDGITTKTYTITVTRPGITLNPANSNITAFSSATMTVTLAAPSVAGTTVTLSSNSAAVTVPASVTVLTGNTQATFSATSVAAGAANVTITATLGSESPTATVSVSGQCTVAADCPGTDTICQTRTCNANTCGFSYASSATVCSAASCTAGISYAQSNCDGAGTCAPAASIACFDNNQCTVDTCSGTSCSYPLAANGTPCSLANATASCTSGACGITACTTGFKDCDASAANGCETDITSNVNNCGVCGHVCGGGSCTGGVCTCADGVKDGTESDVDCGGTCTTKCSAGKTCAVNTDCASNNCLAGMCQ